VHDHRLVSVVKIVIVLDVCTTEEQRSFVRFYGQKDFMQRIFIKKCVPVYGGKCLWRKNVRNWVEKLFQRRSKMADDARNCDRSSLQRVEEMIRADVRITIDSVATALECSHGLACSIMHERLKFRKVRTVVVERAEGSRKNEPNGSVLATSLTVCR
jgi:hypothetical protein